MSLKQLTSLFLLLTCSCGVAPDASEGTFATQHDPLQSDGGLESTVIADSIWNEGWCGRVLLHNHAAAAIGTWSLQLDFGGTTLNGSWNANFSASSGVATVTPVAWTAHIDPGGEVSFGFCATRSPGAAGPSVVAISDDLPSSGVGGTSSGGAGSGGESSGGAGSGGTAAGGTGSGGEACTNEPVAPPTGRVTMRVSNVDDNVLLLVNGLRAHQWAIASPDLGELVDVSRFFHAGENDVELMAMNGGGPMDYDIELFVDGLSTLARTCSGECIPGVDVPAGILLHESLDLTLTDLPEPQQVTVTSPKPGQLYVDDYFTGRTTPTTLSLPAGEFTLGLGQAENVYGAYTGQYFEEALSVQNCPVEVSLGDGAPLPVQNHTEIGVLPIRTTYHGSSSEVGVLLDSDIPPFLEQIAATSDAWVEPFSYGLTDWVVTLLPTVENAVLQRAPDAEAAPDTNQLLTDAGLQSLRADYDIIVFYYSDYHADGTTVAYRPCCAWTGGQDMSYHAGIVRDAAPGTPGIVLYHESLHSYEYYNFWREYGYNGADGLHGAEEHGYSYGQNGEFDFLAWYRDFARGLAVETDDMRAGTTFPTIPPQGDAFVGVFDVMRHGIVR